MTPAALRTPFAQGRLFGSALLLLWAGCNFDLAPTLEVLELPDGEVERERLLAMQRDAAPSDAATDALPNCLLCHACLSGPVPCPPGVLCPDGGLCADLYTSCPPCFIDGGVHDASAASDMIPIVR